MTDVVDSDELMRRIRRARTCARQDLRTWRARSEDVGQTDPAEARDAHVRALAHEAVLRALDEILTPGQHPEEQ